MSLRPVFEDLLDDLDLDLAPADPARAWAGGRRRRVRARAGTAAAVAVVVASAVLGVLGLPRPGSDEPTGPSGSRPHVTGYPIRVDRPLRIRDLPTRPGPVAGLIQSGVEWYAVSSSGATFKVPVARADVLPTLSQDGTRLGYLGSGGVYVIHDLVTGSVAEYPDLTTPIAGAETPGAKFFAGPQSPAFFSPDGTRLLVRGGDLAGSDDVDALLVTATGHADAVDVKGPGSYSLAGWVDDTTIAWLGQPVTAASRGHGQAYDLLTTTIDGRIKHRVGVGSNREDSSLNQWSGSVSADGRVIAVRQASPSSARVQGGLYSVASGGFVVYADLGGADATCPLSWAAVPVISAGGKTTLRPRPEIGRADGNAHLTLTKDTFPVIGVSRRWHAECTFWAADALNGQRHRGLSGLLVGMDDSWWTWFLPQELVGLALAVLALAWWRRRARLARPVSGAPAPGSG